MNQSSSELLESIVVVMFAGKAAEARAARGSSPGWTKFLSPEERIAAHESGHAVAVVAVDMVVFSASISPLDSAPGESHASDGRVQFGINPKARAVTRPAIPDIRQIAPLLMALAERPGWRGALAVGRRLRSRSAALIEANWPAVIALSGELQKRRDLSQAEVEHILRPRAIAE